MSISCKQKTNLFHSFEKFLCSLGFNVTSLGSGINLGIFKLRKAINAAAGATSYMVGLVTS